MAIDIVENYLLLSWNLIIIVANYLFHLTSKDDNRQMTFRLPIGCKVKWDILRSRIEWLMQAWIARPQLSASMTQSSITTNGGILLHGKSVEKFPLIESYSIGRVSKIFIPDTSFSDTGISPASLQNAFVPWRPVNTVKQRKTFDNGYLPYPFTGVHYRTSYF